ncbi:MAG: HDOD domain-containing protein [Candidatus Accumulibacter sp.]|nr:HDOD domain-containing protein [Accumulibacter sp.]
MMNTSRAPSTDMVGEALNTEGFQMIQDLTRELAGDFAFPTCFEAALRLRQALQNPDLPISRISNIVSGEPLVAAKLMQLANSALYKAHHAPVMDLKAAIGRLGIDMVRTTALAIAMRQFIRSKEILVFNDLALALWEHSLKTAAGARILARNQTLINQDEALLAGLVHNLGAFFLLGRAARYAKLRADPMSVKQLIAQWHESIGVTLLRTLGIPGEIVDATVDHSQPWLVPETILTLADIVYIGNILTGAHVEWLHQDFDLQGGGFEVVRNIFGGILPEIESDARAMQVIYR